VHATLKRNFARLTPGTRLQAWRLARRCGSCPRSTRRRRLRTSYATWGSGTPAHRAGAPSANDDWPTNGQMPLNYCSLPDIA